MWLGVWCARCGVVNQGHCSFAGWLMWCPVTVWLRVKDVACDLVTSHRDESWNCWAVCHHCKYFVLFAVFTKRWHQRVVCFSCGRCRRWLQRCRPRWPNKEARRPIAAKQCHRQRMAVQHRQKAPPTTSDRWPITVERSDKRIVVNATWPTHDCVMDLCLISLLGC